MSFQYAFPNQVKIHNQPYWGLAAPLCSGAASYITDKNCMEIQRLAPITFHKLTPEALREMADRQIVPCPPALAEAVAPSPFLQTADKILGMKRSLEVSDWAEEMAKPPYYPLPSLWEGHFGAVLEHNRTKIDLEIPACPEISKKKVKLTPDVCITAYFPNKMTCNPGDLFKRSQGSLQSEPS